LKEESEDGDENESDNSSDSEDNDCAPMIEQLSSSMESLIGEFKEMYDSMPTFASKGA
jgi:hypothetical protein